MRLPCLDGRLRDQVAQVVLTKDVAAKELSAKTSKPLLVISNLRFMVNHILHVDLSVPFTVRKKISRKIGKD